MLRFTEPIDTPNLHVFDNAAFSDDEEEEKEEMPSLCVSWRSERPTMSNLTQSDFGKENQSPDVGFATDACFFRPQKPLALSNSQSGENVPKPLKSILKSGVSSSAKNSSECDRISAGIEEIENEIQRLTGKLADLRLQQAAVTETEGKAPIKTKGQDDETNKGRTEKKREPEIPTGDSRDNQSSVCIKPATKRGRTVAAKFMEGIPSSTTQKKTMGVPDEPPRVRQDRRKSCFVKLPAEEVKEAKKTSRSLSLSPHKSPPRIFKNTGFPTVGSKVPARRTEAAMSTKPRTLFPNEASRSAQRDNAGKFPEEFSKPSLNRRKSCYFKLPEEEKKNKEVRRSSLSPKRPRPSISKAPGFLTVGSTKAVKRDGRATWTQPKALFQEEEAGLGRRKSVFGNPKNSKAIGSRYGQTGAVVPANVKEKSKQECPEKNKQDIKRIEEQGIEIRDGKNVSPENLEQKKNKQDIKRIKEQGIEIRDGKKFSPENLEQKTMSVPHRKVWMKVSPVTAMANLIPKIRTIRTSLDGSPRDSGCVKRAADRIGKKSYFGTDEELASSKVVDGLSFEED